MEHEAAWRLGVFFGILAAVAVWESLAPKRVWQLSRIVRWSNHIALSAINTFLVRIVIPLTIATYALFLDTVSFGLLNWLELWPALAIIAGVVLLDLAIYVQHYCFHKIELCWRLHRMHHTDIDFDVTTAVRFHPIEILLSMGIKFAVVTALGPPAAAVVIFEILLNATSMFNHGNIRLPVSIDRWLRYLIVTPDMHRVHHSSIREETDSNFGFNLPWWDRLFGTYVDQPANGHDRMTIGLEIFRDVQETRVDRLISQPFRTPSVD